VPEMDEDPAEIDAVFLHPMIEFPYFRQLQEQQNTFLQLAASLARDDFQ
jgi:hypothetical protein